MTYVPPGVTPQTSSASNIGGSTQVGRTIALVASFPKGPAWPITRPGSNFPTPYPVPSPATFVASSKTQLLSTWGDDFSSNDLAGYGGPGMGRLIFENNAGLTPQVFVVRVNTTQASITVPNGSGTVVWTATALLTLGGSMGNGIQVQYSGTTFTVTPPVGLTGYSTETWTVPSSATWAQVAAVVNGQSKMVYLNSASADTVATAASTSATLAGGADGANPTSTNINAALDSLLNLTYEEQPLHYLVPGYADSGTGGVIKHALGNAISMLANGQRCRVIGACSPAAGGTGNLTTILAMAADLLPTDNGGDDGRCVFWASNQPYRIDPATGSERLYPAYMVAAAFAGLDASVKLAQPVGRAPLSGFTRFAEGYTVSERTGASGLLAAGAMVCRPNGRLIDQVTTAIATSYRREDSVDRSENFWVADLEDFLNQAAIELASGPAVGITIDDYAELKLRSYVENAWIAGYSCSVHQTSGDARNWEVDVQYNPVLPVRTINPLSVQLVIPVAGPASAQITV